MDPEMQALLQKLQAQRAKGPLPPQLEGIYQKFVASGLIQPEAPPVTGDRQRVVNALRPKDFRPVDRNPDTGMPEPEMDMSGYPVSKQYGGVMAAGGGQPRQAMDPEALAQHYQQQLDLEAEGGKIGDASGGRRVTGAANTEVRPWAQRTPAAYKEAGMDPKQAPLQPVRKVRGAPDVYTSPTTMTEEQIMRLLMGQQ